MTTRLYALGNHANAPGRLARRAYVRSFGLLTVTGFVLLVAVYALHSQGDSSTGGRSASAKANDDTPPGSGSRAVEIVDQGADYRVVRHALGTTRVPASPRRLCALGYLDELLAIGVKPMAASSFNGHFPDYLEDQLDGVTDIPQMYGNWQPNFEAILAAQPDLILTSNSDPQTYRQLSKIAPVVVLTNSGQHCRERLLDVGLVLGCQHQAEVRAAWYDAKIRAAQEALGDKMGDRKVAFFRIFGKQYYIHGRSRGGLVLYDDLKLNPPTLLAGGARGMMLSPEALLDLDADYIFIAAERSKGTYRSLDQLLDHPAWQRVPAVRSSHVVRLHSFHQWLVAGVLGKALIVDEILAAVAPEALDEVNARAESAAREVGS